MLRHTPSLRHVLEAALVVWVLGIFVYFYLIADVLHVKEIIRYYWQAV